MRTASISCGFFCCARCRSDRTATTATMRSSPASMPILSNDLGNLAQRSLTMIARQFDGVVPQPAALSDTDRAILDLADAMIDKAREAMKTRQLHQVLNMVWAVVAEANRYFAGEAPWALAKTDPETPSHGALRHDRGAASGRGIGSTGNAARRRDVARPTRHSGRGARVRPAGRCASDRSREQASCA